MLLNPYVFRARYLHDDNRKSETGSPGLKARSHPASKFQLSKVGFPIRKSVGQRPFAPHHSLSQRTTSFIASYRQGIHQMLLGHLIALIKQCPPGPDCPAARRREALGASRTLGMVFIARLERPEFNRDKPIQEPRLSGPRPLRATRTWESGVFRHISSSRW